MDISACTRIRSVDSNVDLLSRLLSHLCMWVKLCRYYYYWLAVVNDMTAIDVRASDEVSAHRMTAQSSY